MSYRAVLKCADGCPGSHPIDAVLYRCPRCGDLLEVAHDLDALRDKSPDAWRRLFDRRYRRTAWPYGSSVWGKKEWIAPAIRDEQVVSMDEGGTNLFLATSAIGCCGEAHGMPVIGMPSSSSLNGSTLLR